MAKESLLLSLLMENNQHLSEPERIRRQKLVELNQLGINAYPPELFEVNTTSVEIKQEYPKDIEANKWKEISIAGRIMSVRDMGKANFAVIQDDAGRIQVYVRRDDICTGDDKTLYDV
ncbi:MAG: OB-fold nucleic acid binding domain-containing protein, partial [Bacteroidia bacterium]